MASLKLVYLFTIVSFIYFVTTKAQDTDGFRSWSCLDSLTTPNSAFHLNLRSLLSYLSSNATANKQYYNTTVTSRNQSDSTVYGMFLCWGDVPPQPCSHCVVNAIKSINSFGNCSLSTDADVQYDDCMVRFSNRSFFSIPDLVSGGSCSYLDVSNQTNLMSLLSKTMKEAADEAANSAIGAKKYATKEARMSGSFQTLYCEAQCTPDLSPQDCRKCLNTTESQQWCKGLPAMYTKSCWMRCDVYPFYRPSTTSAPTGIVPVSNSSNTYSQDPVYIFHKCTETKITEHRAFQSNLRSLLSSLTSKSTIKTGFFNTTVDMVSGLFMCRGDLSPALCQLCVISATQRISSACPSSKEAIIWYNNCLLRYSNNRSSLSTLDTTPSYQDFNIHNTTKPNQLQSFFTWTLANTLNKFVQYETDDSTIKNYGTKAAKLNNHQTLYILAQCTPDLGNGACSRCLEKIFNDEIPWCCLASPEGKVLYPSCYIMFGLSQFFTDGDQVDAYKPASAPPTTAGDVPIQAIFSCKRHPNINQLKLI
ncbi:hypothetical protein GYH30_055592 [Glycine max]|nr:hypothetical protein GYH30_055592 [Glycine max]